MARGIFHPMKWSRDGRGKEIQFYATNEEIISFFSLFSQENEGGAFFFEGADLVRDDETGRFFEQPFSVSLIDAFDKDSNNFFRHRNLWLRSEQLTESIVSIFEREIGHICSLSGLVLFQPSFGTKKGNSPCRLSIVCKVRNNETLVVHRHSDYIKIFRGLQAIVENALCYESMHRFPDGHEETNGKILRMTQGVAQLHKEGVTFLDRPVF